MFSGLDCDRTVGYHGCILPQTKRRCRTYIWAGAWMCNMYTSWLLVVHTGAEDTGSGPIPNISWINWWSPAIFSGVDCHNLHVKITVGYHGCILPHAKRCCRTYTWAGAWPCNGYTSWTPCPRLFFLLGLYFLDPPTITMLTVFLLVAHNTSEGLIGPNVGS